MRIRTPLGRGLLYGVLFGGVMGGMPLLAFLFQPTHLDREAVLILTIMLSFWGGLGFAVGYLSFHEANADRSSQPLPPQSNRAFTYWAYRVVAGLLLGFVAGTVVWGFWFAPIIIWHFSTPNRGISSMELRILRPCVCAWIGSAIGSFMGGWLGAIVAPGENRVGNLSKWAFVASGIAALAGGAYSAAVGIFIPDLFTDQQAFLISATIGVFASSGGAMGMRWLARWRSA